MAHHFFVPPGALGDRVVLRGAEGHHAVRVLRCRPGERISLADGGGRVADAVVTSVGDDELEARVILLHEHERTAPALVLCQAVAKGPHMDLVIQKAVEVGAERIVPFVAARSVVRWDEDKRQRAVDRWRAIALSAAKQCRSAFLTDVEAVAPGVDALTSRTGLVLVLHESADRGLREVLPAEAPPEVSIVVGPEGGLDDDELGVLAAGGALATRLGERVLRTETAGLVGLALVGFAYGRIG